MIKLLEELTGFSLYLLSYMSECNSSIAESSVLLHWFRALEICFMYSLQGTYSSYFFVCVCIMKRDFNKKHTHCEKGKLVQVTPRKNGVGPYPNNNLSPVQACLICSHTMKSFAEICLVFIFFNAYLCVLFVKMIISQFIFVFQ